MHVSALIHDLLPVLYRGAANPASWATFLNLLCDRLGAGTAAVVATDCEDNLTFLHHVGMDSASQRACAAQFRDDQPARASVVPLQRARSSGPRAGTERRERQSLVHFHHAGMRLCNIPGFSRAGITILRSAERACFSAEEIGLLEQLVPHVEEVLQLQQQFTSLQREEGLLLQLSRSFDLAYILSASDGRPQLLSPPAQEVVRRGDGLRLQDGRLHAMIPNENVQLYKMLTTACMVAPQVSTFSGAETTMTVSRTRPNKALQITVQQLQTRTGHSCALLFLRDPAAQPASRAAVLRQFYRLLPSEVRLAESLTDGLDVKHAAVRQHITENSARTLLKSVFRKLEVNSQAGLIRTVLALPAE